MRFLIRGLPFVLLGACTAGLATTAEPAGFWLGLWHGLIAIFAFIYGLFDSSVAIYEVHNTGSWYDLGYLIGASICFGSGHQSGRSWSKRRRRCEEAPDSGHVRVDIQWDKDDHSVKVTKDLPVDGDLPGAKVHQVGEEERS